MNGNVRFWTDVVVGRCMRNSMSPAEAVYYDMCCSIAQLMKFWRNDLPPKWEGRVGDEVPASVAYDAFERLKPAYMFGQAVDIPANEFYEVLNGPELTSNPALSPKAWKVVREVTGMGEQDWEQLPASIQSVLDKHVTCPKCGASGKLTEVAGLVSAPDPFLMGSGAALHVACKHCGEELTVDTAVKGLEIVDKRWSNTRNTIFWAAIVAFVLALIAVLRLAIFK
jgi:transcription elongation factor Elf1